MSKTKHIRKRKHGQHYTTLRRKQSASSSASYTNQLTIFLKALSTPYGTSNPKLRDDYYNYINYEWLDKKNQELKSNKTYYVKVDSFRETQDKVNRELIGIVNDYTSQNTTAKSKSIQNLYHSMLNLNTSEAENYAVIARDELDRYLQHGTLYDLLAYVNKNEIVSWGCPIVWSVQKEPRNSISYKGTISAPVLTLYDYYLYIELTEDDEDTQANKKKFKETYFKFIRDMFRLIEGQDHPNAAEEVWEAELTMLTALGCDGDKTDDENGYNLINTSESLKKCGLDWAHLAEKIGYTAVPDTFVCTSLNYVQCIMKSLEEKDNWKTQSMWRTYFLYIEYRQLMRFHDSWRHVYYEFHGKFISGQPVIWPNDLYPVFGLSMCYNTFLTEEYVARNRNEEYENYVKTITAELLQVFKEKIERNTWLSPETKKAALLKLTHINLIIGQPPKLREDPILPYTETGAYQNMLQIAHWRAKQMIEVDGTSTEYDIPIIDWNQFKLVGKQSYVVNAYYTPSENSIYVPQAYLQKPFIDLNERGIEYNLAYIGYTMAHEMSHSLDDTGSKYDHMGNMVNWWTPEDRKQFDKRVQNVVKQYEYFALQDGIKMDAKLSTGENIADIAGLSICLEYLRQVQEKNNDITPIRALSFESFFTYIAVQSRQKIYANAVAAQLKTNPHPINKYRTNCPLARMKLFRTIYNIEPKDKMYWESDDVIW